MATHTHTHTTTHTHIHTHTHTHTHTFASQPPKHENPPKKTVGPTKDVQTNNLTCMLKTSKNEAMPCTTIAIPLQGAATATHRSRRSKGRILLLQPTQTWPAHEGKRNFWTNQKTPNLHDMERATQERSSYEKQKKRSTLQSAICTESRPVGLGEVRTRPYRPREQ